MQLTEEKLNRISGALVVNAIILTIVLIAVLVYQFVEIGVLSKHKRELNEEYKAIIKELDESQDWLNRYELQQDEMLYILALQNGYKPAN